MLVDSGGSPSSVTTTLTAMLVGPWASVGVQVKRPVWGLISAPAGAPSPRLKVRFCAGRSLSTASIWTVSGDNSSTVWSITGIKMGGVFNSLTIMVKVCQSDNGGLPSSVTRTVIWLVLGPWFSLGRQLKVPLMGSMNAPSGAPASRLKKNVCAGKSTSAALTVKPRNWFSFISQRLVDPGVITGGVFTSLTIMVKVLDAESWDLPLSVAFTVTRLVPGP